MAPPPPRRLQSQHDDRRDTEGFEARQRRERQAAPIVSDDFDDYTAQYERGEITREQLDYGRSRRTTPSWRKHMEKVRDEDRAELKALAIEVHNTSNAVAKMDGKLDAIPKMLELLEGKEQTKRLGITTRAKIIVAIVAAFGTGIGALVTALASRG